jgi:hypothetical protein
MKPISHSFNEGSVYGLWIFWTFEGCIESFGVEDHLISFLNCPHVRYLSTVQDVVDVFQEYLIDDLIIRE